MLNLIEKINFVHIFIQIIVITSITEDDDDDSNAEAPTTRRPVPPPQPRRQPIAGTKGGTKTAQPSTQSPLKTRVVITTTTTAPLKEESDNESEKDEEELEVTSTSRPAVQPRITTQRPRGVKIPSGSTKTRPSSSSSRPVLRTTTSGPLDENEESVDEKSDLLPAKPEVPRPLGRKVISRRPNTEQPSSALPVSIVTTPTSVNVNNRRVISKTNMAVPKPVSFNRRSKTRDQAAETTTLEPIPVPAFEPTRRSVNPIIQSITIDNEEESSENLQLPRKKSAVRNVGRIYTSDLAKFSSRIRYSERQPLNSQLKFSSYSPPLIDSLVEPNEPFIEINRIK